MSIEIQCPTCSKRYRVEDRFAGKRVKCRNCAAPISVPMEDSSLDEVESLEGAVPGAPDAEFADEPVTGPADRGGVDEAAEELPQGFGAAIQAARARSAKRRFAISEYPGAAIAHQHLPWIMGLACIGLSIYFAIQRVYAGPEPRWPRATLFGSALFLFLIAVIPMTSLGIKRASEMLRFSLPDGTGWRTLGLFSLPLLLAMMLSDSLAGIICGLAVGILMLMPLIWATFQLHWVEAVVAWMMGSLFFAATSAAAGGLVFFIGLGVTLSTVGNPPPQPAPKSIAKLPPTNNTIKPPVTTAPATQPDTPLPTPVNASATQPVLPGDPTVLLPPPLPDFPTVTPPPTTNPAVPTPPTPPPVAKSDHVKIEPSPIVSAARELTWIGEYEQILDLDSLVSPLAVLKRTQLLEAIEIVRPEGDKPAATVSFKRDPGGSDGYLVSPNSESLVRAITWPKPGLQLWSAVDNKTVRSTDLDEQGATATPLCFITADQVLVHRSMNDIHAMQVYNVKRGEKVRQQRIPVMVENGYAISPDGRTLAVATKMEGSPQIHLIELATGRTRKIAIPLAQQWPLAPAGMAFSPDSSKIAILFEQDGNVLAVAWNTGSTVKTQEHVYPAGTLAVPPRTQYKGRGLDWLADNGTWLMFGNLVVDVPSGQVVGTLGVPAAFNQRVAEGKRIYLEATAETGAKRIVQVELNADAINKARPAPPK